MEDWIRIIFALVLYVSSMSPGEIPDTGVAVSDKALHLTEYAIMGILAGAPWYGHFPGLLAFVPVLELLMNAGRISWYRKVA